MGGLLGARGRRASGCGRSGGPASRDCWISPLKQSTPRHMFAWFASVSWDTPRRVEQTPQIERRNQTKNPKRLLVKFNAFENDCLKIHFPTNEMQIKLNEINKIELKQIIVLVKTGP